MPRTKVTPEELAAARDEVTRLRAEHVQQLTAAREQLAARGEAVAAGEADRLVESETAEMFAAADQLGAELDDAIVVEQSLRRARFGTDPADAPGAREALTRGDRPDVVASIADLAFMNEDFVAALAAGPAAFRREAYEILSAEQTAFMLARDGTMMPSAAQFDGSPLVPDDQRRLATPYRLPQRAPALLEIMPTGTTDGQVIKFVRKTTNTSGITGKTAGTAFTQATYVYTPATENIVSRGAMLPVPEDNLADQGRMKSVLEGDMVRDNRLDLENQVVNGDGVGENMTGLLNTAGIASLTRDSGDDLSAAAYKILTAVRTNAFVDPDHLAYGATDIEVLATETDSTGNYKNTGGIFGTHPMTMWGKPSVLGHVLPANTMIGGLFSEVEIVVRQGIQITEYQGEVAAAEQLIYLRGKYRAGFIVKVPQAFAVLDTTVVV